MPSMWDGSVLTHASLNHPGQRLTAKRREALHGAAEAGSGSVALAVAASPALAAEVVDLDLVGQIEAISACAESDLLMARILQVDLDARSLLPPDARAADPVVYGLLPDTSPGVVATRTADGWHLTGQLTQCAHPHSLGRAVLVARHGESGHESSESNSDHRSLFDVDLKGTGATPGGRAFPIAAPGDPNGPIEFEATPARRLDGAPWPAGHRAPIASLLRDAACWHGASVAIARAFFEQDSTFPSLDERSVGLGRVTSAIELSGLSLLSAAVEVAAAYQGDPWCGDVPAETARLQVAAAQARVATANAAETVIRQHVLFTDPRGDGPEERALRRVGLLQVALRRFDRKGDLAALGRLVASHPAAPPDVS